MSTCLCVFKKNEMKLTEAQGGVREYKYSFFY